MGDRRAPGRVLRGAVRPDVAAALHGPAVLVGGTHALAALGGLLLGRRGNRVLPLQGKLKVEDVKKNT